MAYLRHGLVLLYQKACQKASIRARFSHNFLFREGLRLILGKPTESGSARLGQDRKSTRLNSSHSSQSRMPSSA